MTRMRGWMVGILGCVGWLAGCEAPQQQIVETTPADVALKNYASSLTTRDTGVPDYNQNRETYNTGSYYPHKTSLAYFTEWSYKWDEDYLRCTASFKIHNQYVGNTWSFQVQAVDVGRDKVLASATGKLECRYENSVWTDYELKLPRTEIYEGLKYGYRDYVVVFDLVWTGKDNCYYARQTLTSWVYRSYPASKLADFYSEFEEAKSRIANDEFERAESILTILKRRDEPMEKTQIAHMLGLLGGAIQARDERKVLEEAEQVVARVESAVGQRQAEDARTTLDELKGKPASVAVLDRRKPDWRKVERSLIDLETTLKAEERARKEREQSARRHLAKLPLTCTAISSAVSKSEIRLPLRVAVPILKDAGQAYGEEFDGNRSNVEDRREQSLSQLQFRIMNRLKQSGVFSSVLAGAADQTVDAELQINVRDNIAESLHHTNAGDPTWHRDRYRCSLAITVELKARRGPFRSTHDIQSAEVLPNRKEPKRATLQREEEGANEKVIDAVVDQLVQALVTDVELAAFAKAAYEERLATIGTVTLPRFEVIEPVNKRLRAATVPLDCRIRSKHPLETIEVVLNESAVARFAPSIPGEKGVGVSSSLTRLEIDWLEDGAALRGRLAVGPGRNVLEVIATIGDERTSRQTIILNNEERDVDKRPIPQRWALCVGIDQYRHGGENLKPLEFAAADAKAMHDFLLSKNGGAFSSNNIRLLLNDDATTIQVREALFEFLGKSGKEDFVLIYFSCHGAPAPQNLDELYLVTHDTHPERMASTGLPMAEIDRALRGYIKAERVLILADSCHSGGVSLSPGAREIDSNKINEHMKRLAQTRPGRAIFTASETSERSYEGSEFGGGHGAFTHYLLEALRGKADKNMDGEITLGEAVDYTREAVTKATKGKQHPDTAGKFDRNLPLSLTNE